MGFRSDVDAQDSLEWEAAQAEGHQRTVQPPGSCEKRQSGPGAPASPPVSGHGAPPSRVWTGRVWADGTLGTPWGACPAHWSDPLGGCAVLCDFLKRLFSYFISTFKTFRLE